MSQEPYVPVGMSDAEVALLQQAHEYRGSDLFGSPEDSRSTVAEELTVKEVWDRARTQLRRKVIGSKVKGKKSKSKSSKRVKALKTKASFVRGGALAVAILSLLLVPMFGVLSIAAAIFISGRAVIVGRLRGLMLISMVFVQLLSWALLFRVA